MKKIVIGLFILVGFLGELNAQNAHIHASPYLVKIFEYYKNKESFIYIQKVSKDKSGKNSKTYQYILNTTGDSEKSVIKNFLEEVNYALKFSEFDLTETTIKGNNTVYVWEAKNRIVGSTEKDIFIINIKKDKEKPEQSTISVVLTTIW